MPETAALDLHDLDAAQRAAVVSEARPLCILAGAGSGKTRVLTRRIAHRVINADAEAGHVLAVTFTRKAAGELRRRLVRLGVRDAVAAGTFHALAWAQLRRRWADRGEPAPALLERKARVLAPLLPRARSGQPGAATIQTADLAGEIEWAKARMVGPEGYEAEVAATRRKAPVAPATMAALYQRYEDEKRAKRMVDFDDLLLLCARALEDDPAFAAAQRWRFRHLFVDEFQDVNPVQFRLLMGWLGGDLDLCVVGDPHQAIYSWNGADPTLLTGFRRHFPSADVIDLDRNYRSTPQVVVTAQAVLGSSSGGRQAVRDDGPVPVLRQFDSDIDEARGVARILRRAHRPGVAWSHLAVLTRTNAQLVTIERHLRAAGIPCRLTGAGALLAQPEVKEALAHLRRLPPATPFPARLADIEAMALEHEEGTTERRLNLEALVQLGHDYTTIDTAASAEGFAAWLAASVRGDGVDTGGDVVELTTFHRAKGLEWPVVVICGLERGLVPIGHATTPAAEAEERRLLYVALTRAIDELHCTWAERRTFGSASIPRSPSPYLEPIRACITAMAAGGSPADWQARIEAERAKLRRISSPAGKVPDPPLLTALKAWRATAARTSGVPAYVIFHDTTLRELARARPRSRAQLLQLAGIGPVKADRYGEAVLAVVADHAS